MTSDDAHHGQPPGAAAGANASAPGGRGDPADPCACGALPPDAAAPYVPDDPAGFYADIIRQLDLNLELREPELTRREQLGVGGTAAVHVAEDHILGRHIAVKTLLPELSFSRDQIERLTLEAQAAAQLEHPNIVPIHALGASPTMGFYFTMKRLRGDSLRHIINELAQRNPAYSKEYTHSKLLAIFIKICQGIAYAHSKGIMHRDLKPENIRIGSYGEVTIIDWGLVREVNAPTPTKRYDAQAARQADRQERGVQQGQLKLTTSNPTINGQLCGTPRYMSPEQADGQIAELDIRTDIYSLGVILYELLTFTNPFSDVTSEDDIINAVTQGEFRRPRQTHVGHTTPPELEAICLKAMSRRKEKRYQTVADLIHDIYAHQEGRVVMAYMASPWVRLKKLCYRNPLKTAILLSATLALCTLTATILTIERLRFKTTIEEAGDKVSQAISLQARLEERLKKEKHDEASRAAPAGQRATDANDDLQNEIDNLFDSANQMLSSISTLSQWRPEVRFWRERIMRERLLFALRHHRLAEVERWLRQMRNTFGTNLEKCSPEMLGIIRGVEIARRGDCIVTMTTTPHPAALELRPVGHNPENDCLEPLAPLPLESDSPPIPPQVIPKGNYLITARLPGHAPVFYPVFLVHGETRDIVIAIPRAIPENTVYVPDGMTLVGGAVSQLNPKRREYLEGFFISKYEVTFGEYLEFWKSLTDPQARIDCMSRIHFQALNDLAVNAWSPEGRLNPGFAPDRPVVGISHQAAMAFCTWKSQALNRPCRLPTAAEWEKAARGADGRDYPWGNSFRSTYTYTFENAAVREAVGLWAPPGAMPFDQSPYGVFDMAGNVREWTGSKFPDGTSFNQIKGASSATTKRYLPLDSSDDTPLAPSDVGFRFLLPVQPDDFQYPAPAPPPPAAPADVPFPVPAPVRP